MPRISIVDVDDASACDLEVRAAPNAADVLLVHDPGVNLPRRVLLVTGGRNAAGAYEVRTLSSAAAAIMLAESR